MGLIARLKGLFGSPRCLSCRGELVSFEGDVRGSVCRNCRLFYPSAEEGAVARAYYQTARRLLTAVAELHELGYQCARIVPYVCDTAGGGDWWCEIVPAALTSPLHGARFDERIYPWGSPQAGEPVFPGHIGRAWHAIAGDPTYLSAASLLRRFPALSQYCLGRDEEYVSWYRDMLRATEPAGLVYAEDSRVQDDSLNDSLRVLFYEEAPVTRVPLPPPGRAPARPSVFDPSWRTETVRLLARGMDESGDFSSAPILADALQDAGCDDEHILGLCRTPEQRIHSNWVVYLVLRKE